MARAGLSLTADGQVFFNSNDALVLPDADNRQDVYEWEPQGTGNCQPESPAFFELSADCVSLISSGTGQFALEPARGGQQRNRCLLLHSRNHDSTGRKRPPGEDL